MPGVNGWVVLRASAEALDKPALVANTVVTLLDKENMPFTESFWQKNNKAGSRVELKNIKGYFTVIPVHWTEGENNLLPYNMRLIASNDVRKDHEYQIADNRTINGFEGDLS